MHDPMTVAFEIRSPFRQKPCALFPEGYRKTLVTIWHRDPELGGDDSSCWRERPSEWRGWRWHFWHWRIQFHPIQALKRWLFSRCAGCGKGFPWDYSPVSLQWNGTGPRWFRGEHAVYHHECERT